MLQWFQRQVPGQIPGGFHGTGISVSGLRARFSRVLDLLFSWFFGLLDFCNGWFRSFGQALRPHKDATQPMVCL